MISFMTFQDRMESLVSFKSVVLHHYSIHQDSWSSCATTDVNFQHSPILQHCVCLITAQQDVIRCQEHHTIFTLYIHSFLFWWRLVNTVSCIVCVSWRFSAQCLHSWSYAKKGIKRLSITSAALHSDALDRKYLVSHYRVHVSVSYGIQDFLFYSDINYVRPH